MPWRRPKTQGFAVCLRNAGYSASLEVRKLYPVLRDPNAEANDLIRVIDESGEDYLYPKSWFVPVAVPQNIEELLHDLVMK